MTEFYSSRTLRNLVLSSADGKAVAFIEKLWASVFKDRCQQFLGKQSQPAHTWLNISHHAVYPRHFRRTSWAIAGSHAEKVIAALLECGCESVREAAHQQLEVGLGGF